MTLVVAASGSDFIILGTDSRGTIVEQGGTRVEVNIMKKLVPVSKHVAIMLYGAANEATYLIEQFQSEMRPTLDGVTEVAKQFASFCRNEARLSADVPRLNMPYFGFIVAGLDKKASKYIPRAYSLRSTDGYCLGSYQKYALQGKPMIAYYIFSAYYDENLNMEEMRELVAVSINETRKIDGDVGGSIRMATIDLDGFREILNTDIEGYLREWEKNRLIRNRKASDKILEDDEIV